MSDEKLPTHETKRCAHCSESIQKTAQKCKHCGADLRGWMYRHPIWTVVLILMGLSIFLSAVSSNPSTSPTATASYQNSGSKTEIVSINTKITEKNSVWWKYAWVLVLKNNSATNKTVNAKLKWVDADGFVVDSDNQYSLAVPAGQEATFNDYALIDASVAGNVTGIEAEIE